MPEEVFRFKKFNIIQNEGVHKIGTDSVLLGAWVGINGVRTILDIGTGTGVMAIMLAQRTAGEIKISAIEMDGDAIALAKRNIENSSFAGCIQTVHSKVQDFKSQTLYDLIVCNPPYFIDSLKPPTKNRVSQRHTDDLTFDEILVAITSLLSPSGRLGLVLPVREGDKFIELAQNFGLSLSRQCNVFSKEGKEQERYLFEFSYRVKVVQKSKLTIMSNDGGWTEEYKSLTRDFYLKF